MKTTTSIILLLIGIFILFFWLSGMHGHIKFRYHMLQDWILLVLVVICLVFLFFFFLNLLVKNKTNINPLVDFNTRFGVWWHAADVGVG